MFSIYHRNKPATTKVDATYLDWFVMYIIIYIIIIDGLLP